MRGGLPIAEKLSNQLLGLRRIELAADGNFAFTRAIELLMELAHVIELEGLPVFDVLVEGRWVARIAALVACVHMAIELDRAERARLRLRAFEAGETLLPNLFELGFRERWLAEEFAHETERIRKVGLERSYVGVHTSGTAADIDLRLEAVGLVLDLLARFVPGAAHQERAGHETGCRFAEDRFLIAEAHVHAHGYNSAARLLREHNE